MKRQWIRYVMALASLIAIGNTAMSSAMAGNGSSMVTVQQNVHTAADLRTQLARGYDGYIISDYLCQGTKKCLGGSCTAERVIVLERVDYHANGIQTICQKKYLFLEDLSTGLPLNSWRTLYATESCKYSKVWSE